MISVAGLGRIGIFYLFAAGVLVAAPAAIAQYSALVVDANTGEVLYEQNAYDYRHPASLTKMMTLYMVFEALQRGRIRLDRPLWVSEYAASRPPSKLGLRPGEILTVQDAIYGLVTQSANDAATVIAEALGGSEFQFAQQMTQRAHQLGMSQSYFRNASGLPDPYQITTAWDMYKLGQALRRDFPQYYYYFSETDFNFRNKILRNHNHLLYNYEGTDGIKTGYIRDSGYNLVASVQRNGHRLIGVVFGGSSGYARDAHMRAILDQGFAKVEYGTPVAILPPPFAMAKAEADATPRPRMIRAMSKGSVKAKPTRSVKAGKRSKSVKTVQIAGRKASTKSYQSAGRTKTVKAGKPLGVAKSPAAKPVKQARLNKPAATAKPVKGSKSAKATRAVKSSRQTSTAKSVAASRSKLLSKAD